MAMRLFIAACLTAALIICAQSSEDAFARDAEVNHFNEQGRCARAPAIDGRHLTIARDRFVPDRISVGRARHGVATYNRQEGGGVGELLVTCRAGVRKVAADEHHLSAGDATVAARNVAGTKPARRSDLTQQAQFRNHQARERALAYQFIENYRKSRDPSSAPEDVIAAVEAALSLDPQITHWPFDGPRDQMIALLRAHYGMALLQRTAGTRADNIERAIKAFNAALTVLNQEILPLEWTATQTNLGNAYKARIRGNRSENLERAINAYKKALSIVHLRERVPLQWAIGQYNLGDVFAKRILGNRSDNLERTIAAFENAVSIDLLREHSPASWAVAQFNLGIAYSVNRVQGQRSDNFERAIAAYENALKVYTRQASPQEWAETQLLLANVYQKRILGPQAENIERAIAAYEKALSVYTRESSPQDWAEMQANLGTAYLDRIPGDRADNIERAIAAYEKALSVYARESSPQEWAEMQTNLGTAYLDRIRGDRADNIERAIAAFDKALTVRSRRASPREWAVTLISQGDAYRERIRGQPANNIERAIVILNDALSVLTREASPREWATAQNNRGLAYLDRIRGERADNLERAIGALQETLTVFTREVSPREWARSQNNLGNVYLKRIRGEEQDNVDLAIAAYKSALTVFNRDALPRLWAESTVNLGNAYLDRTRGDKADNLELAISAYKIALTVHTRAEFPEDWALAQLNLGVAYIDRVRGERADNLERAISFAKDALTIYTREAFPEKWALGQINLAVAYLNRVRGERANNLERAISFAKGALTVVTLEAFPSEHLNAAGLLGKALAERGSWRQALGAFGAARQSFRLLFGQGLNDAEARHLIEISSSVFENAAYAATQLDELELALAWLEDGKTQLLKVALRLDALNLDPQDKARLNDLRQQVRDADLAQQGMSGEGKRLKLDKLRMLRAELFALLSKAEVAESAVRAQTVLPLAASLTPPGGALIAPILAHDLEDDAGKLLIVTASNGNGHLSLIDLPQASRRHLNELLRVWLNAYMINYLPPERRHLRRNEWRVAIDKIAAQLWSVFGRVLVTALEKKGVKRGAELVILPQGPLGLLPLALAQDFAVVTPNLSLHTF